MTNEEQKNAFLEFIGDNLDSQVQKLKRYCSSKHLDYDEDIFSETVLKVAEKIQKNGIQDASESGCDKYFFKAFTQNIRREQQYSRNARRDKNIENLNELYENYCNNTKITAQEKLLSDLKKDFSAVYVLSKVEHEFGSLLARLFTEKFYLSRTYKDLQRMHPSMKKLRDTLLNMKRWTMDNIKREDVDKAFNEAYSDLLED